MTTGASTARPTPSQVLRSCYFGDGREALAGRLAVLAAWCLTVAILLLNVFFRIVLDDGNLLIRAVPTLVLAAPLGWIYSRRKRALLERRTS